MDDMIEKVLLFWFGPKANADIPDIKRTELWFGGDPKTDFEIKSKFEYLINAGKKGQLDHWCDTAHGCLALIIILDQFSRNCYRDSKNAFTQDEKALRICLDGIENSVDQKLSLIERVFFYMPLEHSENINIQIKSVAGFKSLVDLSLQETKAMFTNFYDYAIEHYRVIEEFGRFPYRNEALGRATTVAEKEFLNNLNR